MIDKEEILEEKEQNQKKLQKDSREFKDENDIKTKCILPQSSVFVTPITTEKDIGKEELKKVVEESNKSYTIHSSEQEREKSAAMLKSNSSSDGVRNPPLTPNVPSSTKKAEGSKQL